jgi:hypothetical protein
MASSRRDKAEHRTADTAARIREDLGEGNFPEAVYAGNEALLSELAKLRRHRPADAALIHAEIAGVLAGIASRLHVQRPQRPPTYTGGVPQAEDMLAVFAAAFARAAGNGASNVT